MGPAHSFPQSLNWLSEASSAVFLSGLRVKSQHWLIPKVLGQLSAATIPPQFMIVPVQRSLRAAGQSPLSTAAQRRF